MAISLLLFTKQVVLSKMRQIEITLLEPSHFGDSEGQWSAAIGLSCDKASL